MESTLEVSNRTSFLARVHAVAASALRPLTVVRQYRELIARMVRREIEQRYRGSVLGILWTLITPLMMLATYSFVFMVVFPSKWEGVDVPMPLLLFAGLIIFGVLAEPVNAAPSLVLNNVNYVKKVVFPLEVLVWVSFVSNLFQQGVSMLVWLLIYVVWVGVPPWTLVLLPITLLPLCLMTLGITWILSALGMFLRDLRQAIPVLTTILLFLSPIFFPASKAPKGYELLMYLNPLVWTLENCRGVMVFGRVPDPLSWTIMMLVSMAVAIFGFAIFNRLRMAFSDVV